MPRDGSSALQCTVRVALGLFNEGWGQFDAREMTEMVRALDPTREIDHASGWYDQGSGGHQEPSQLLSSVKSKPEERAFAWNTAAIRIRYRSISTPKNRSATARTRTRHSTRKR